MLISLFARIGGMKRAGNENHRGHDGAFGCPETRFEPDVSLVHVVAAWFYSHEMATVTQLMIGTTATI
jgi:hypothetical protein